MSCTRVLFPDPDTPVTHVKVPRGIVARSPRRLCSVAPLITILPGLRARRSGLPAVVIASPRRWRAVAESPDTIRSAGVPRPTTRPPSIPAPGPRSMIPVRGANGCLVVLDNDHTVPPVAEVGQAGEQSLRVAGV